MPINLGGDPRQARLIGGGADPGLIPQNPHGKTQEATKDAQQAVLGLMGAGPGGQAGAQNGAGGGSFPGFTQAGEGSNYSVDKEGRTSYNVTPNLLPQQGELQRQQTMLEGDLASKAMTQKAGLEKDAFHDKFNTFQPYLGGPGGGGSLPPTVQYGPTGDADPAMAAAYARAKDVAGQQSRAAMNSLSSLMSERGMLGSGYDSAGQRNVVSGAFNQMGDINREQLIQQLQNISHVRDLTYQGGIQQRGQDISKQQAILGLLNSMGGGGLY